MILFPNDSLQRTQVETDYQDEWQAAIAAGFGTRIFNFDGLQRDEGPREILRFLPNDGEGQNIFFRSWMLSIKDYARLATLLTERSFSLITSPHDYELAHHFPNFYPLIKGNTPRSSIVRRQQFERENDFDFAPIELALKTFGDAPVIIKDFVKSQKHRWHEACFIPRASDLEHAEKVVRRFLALQGEFLVGGLVIREFLELKSVGMHQKSGLPLTAEWRIFVFDQEPIFVAPYWEMGYYEGQQPNLDFAREQARNIPCRFFSMDIAQLKNGDWTIIEIGDGQVSGLPSPQLAPDFFGALQNSASTFI